MRTSIPGSQGISTIWFQAVRRVTKFILCPISFCLFCVPTCLAQLGPPPGLPLGAKYHRIFVTGERFRIDDSTSVPPESGFFGGIDAADYIITSLAVNAQLDGTTLDWNGSDILYRAILSAENYNGQGVLNARDRFNITGPVYNTRNELIANDAADLWNGSIQNPVLYDEFRNALAPFSVWTGSNPAGLFGTGSCGHNWNDAGRVGTAGLNTTSSSAWLFNGTSGCSGRTRLYGLSDELTVPVPEPTLALFDIKPGSSPNSVNPKSKGVLPVAILGTAEFNVNDVDIASLLFGDPLLLDNGGMAVSPLRYAFEDVSDDGLLDLTLKFSTADLVEDGALGPDTIEGLLTGELLDGTPFKGMDSIRIVPPNGSHGNSLQTAAVPEPTTSALALAALCLAMSRRRAF